MVLGWESKLRDGVEALVFISTLVPSEGLLHQPKQRVFSVSDPLKKGYVDLYEAHGRKECL